jgi:hypothetical protein
MPTQSAPAARYQDAAGTVHDILVRRTPQGAWEILDTTPTHTRLVETLTGFDEGRAEAEAVARDNAAQHQQRPRQPRGPDQLGFAA